MKSSMAIKEEGNNMWKKVICDYEPRKKIMKKISFPEGEPEMSETQSAFLCGLIQMSKPKKIIEIGTAGGGSTSIMLQALKDLHGEIEGWELYSVDWSKRFYRDKSLETGFIAKETEYILGIKEFRLKTGHCAAYYLDEIDKGIDFCLLDAAYSIPGEVLDFICILPYLSDGAIVCMHDIVINMVSSMNAANIATNVLFNSVVGEKYLNLEQNEFGDMVFPNIGAFQVSQATRDNIMNIIGLLNINWNYIPESKEFERMAEVCGRYYNKEYVDIIKGCYQNNQRLKSSVSDRIRKVGKILLRGRI